MHRNLLKALRDSDPVAVDVGQILMILHAVVQIRQILVPLG